MAEVKIAVNNVIGSHSGKSVHWSPTLTQTRSITSNSVRGDFAMDTTDVDELSSSEPDILIGTVFLFSPVFNSDFPTKHLLNYIFLIGMVKPFLEHFINYVFRLIPFVPFK